MKSEKELIIEKVKIVTYPENVFLIKHWISDPNMNYYERITDKAKEIEKHFEIILYDEKYDYDTCRYYVDIYFKEKEIK